MDKLKNLAWTHVVVFVVVLACVTTLVALGKAPPEYFKYMFVWLLPSPLVSGSAPAHSTTPPSVDSNA